MTSRTELKLRCWRGTEVAMGPGKADLLEAIAAAGSISAAGRAMNMSYRRAWQLVDMMNRSFAAPLVHSAVGGQHGGGARLTDMGKAVLERYRAMEAAALGAIAQHEGEFAELLLPVVEPKPEDTPPI